MFALQAGGQIMQHQAAGAGVKARNRARLRNFEEQNLQYIHYAEHQFFGLWCYWKYIRENPKEAESIEQLFERAYEELRALKAVDEDSKFQLP